ncbi:hypothetical protein FA13DRAFT_1744775 [Coprinellus micaceus]|uniref:Uncharacterized protein n=1 Tax=Coprinellus micaceus TaxID=71717 RepID=A0A4Y7SDP2_COPMI|nr:hypothetical protein FA13DRAFT_1744775 [Coprinellus micaceus]
MALTTDVTPRIHLEPSQVLNDDNRVKRLVTTLSEGIFYGIDEKKASEILQECLKICGGSNETLSQVLQDKFFRGHTPFYWAITNKNPQSHDPPLLKELILYGGALTKATQEDIMEAFRLEFDSVLYEAVKPNLTAVDTLNTCSPSFLQGDEFRPVVTASSHTGGITTLCFDIPRFFDRLLVDGKLSFQFYALESTFCLKAVIDSREELGGRPKWEFDLEDQPPSGNQLMPFMVALSIHSEVGDQYSHDYRNYECLNGYLRVLSPPLNMKIYGSDLAEFYRNPYTANDRGALSGKLTLTR